LARADPDKPPPANAGPAAAAIPREAAERDELTKKFRRVRVMVLSAAKTERDLFNEQTMTARLRFADHRVAESWRIDDQQMTEL
jgi:hypothetical protein